MQTRTYHSDSLKLSPPYFFQVVLASAPTILSSCIMKLLTVLTTLFLFAAAMQSAEARVVRAREVRRTLHHVVDETQRKQRVVREAGVCDFDCAKLEELKTAS